MIHPQREQAQRFKKIDHPLKVGGSGGRSVFFYVEIVLPRDVKKWIQAIYSLNKILLQEQTLLQRHLNKDLLTVEMELVLSL